MTMLQLLPVAWDLWREFERLSCTPCMHLNVCIGIMFID